MSKEKYAAADESHDLSDFGGAEGQTPNQSEAN
jgi:hypothetical protein